MFKNHCVPKFNISYRCLLATGRSKAVVLVKFFLNVFGIGVSFRILYSFVVYLYVSRSGPITSIGEERANCLLLFTCKYVVSIRRGFLFLWVLGMGYVILLWHSLSLPCNYFSGNIQDSQFLNLGLNISVLTLLARMTLLSDHDPHTILHLSME